MEIDPKILLEILNTCAGSGLDNGRFCKDCKLKMTCRNLWNEAGKA